MLAGWCNGQTDTCDTLCGTNTNLNHCDSVSIPQKIHTLLCGVLMIFRELLTGHVLVPRITLNLDSSIIPRPCLPSFAKNYTMSASIAVVASRRHRTNVSRTSRTSAPLRRPQRIRLLLEADPALILAQLPWRLRPAPQPPTLPLAKLLLLLHPVPSPRLLWLLWVTEPAWLRPLASWLIFSEGNKRLINASVVTLHRS